MLAAVTTALLTNHGIAFNPNNGKVYAIDQAHNSISVVDSRLEGIVKSIKVGRAPDALALNTLTNQVYVLNSGDGTVSALDSATDNEYARVAAGSHPYNLAVDETLNKVFVTNTFSDVVAEIDGATRRKTDLHIGSADNLVVDGQTHRVFLIAYEDPQIRILDERTHTVQKIGARDHLWGLTFDNSAKKLYATSVGSDQVIDGSSTVSTGSMPSAMALNSKTGMLYTANYADGTVTAIQMNEKRVIATIHVGVGPQAIAVDERVDRVYVANTKDGTVSVINGPTNAVAKTVAAGSNPWAVTAAANPDVIYVANLGVPSFTAVPVRLP